MGQRPVPKVRIHLKFGRYPMEHEYMHCPRCDHVLNAGPEYLPNYCDQCGQELTFKGIVWKEDREVGSLQLEQGGGGDDQ